MKQQVKHKEISPIQHELAIQFDWEEVEKRIPDTIKKFRENSTFDGFHKGKAPKKVVVAQIGMKTIHERAANTAAWDIFNDAIKQMESSETRDTFKKPITPPEIDLDDIIEGEPIKFTAKYYIQPPEPNKLAAELMNEFAGLCSQS